MRTSTKTRASILAVALLAAGGLVACGTSASGSTEESTATTTEQVAEAPAEQANPAELSSAVATEHEDDHTHEHDDDADHTHEDDVEASESTTVATDGSLPDSDYTGSYTLADEEFGTMVTVTVDETTRSIESNSLPDHETGDYPNSGNPNTITEQSLSYEFPVDPDYTGEATYAQTPGVGVNGVAFEPGTAETVSCESGEVYRVEALQEVYDLGLDFNNAHVQPTGQYHYHGVSELLVAAYESNEDLVHVGFAADGHLMYYSKSGAYESSYQLSTEARTGTDCVASGPAGGSTVEIEGTMPDGTYGSDWVYVEGAGDLDECNGTWIDGEYAYILTDEYPYIPRCLNGEFTDLGPGGAGGGPAPGGAPRTGPPAA